MARPLRLIDPDVAYHVISRGNNKSSIFHGTEDYKKYLSVLDKAKEVYGFSLYHYVLMPNHVHLLIRPNESDLSVFMHVIQMSYAKYYCKKYGFVGHVWQGRFKSLSIENDSYLFACGNYIEMNPVRARLTVSPKAWAWSSYHVYAFGAGNPRVDADPLFETLAKNEEDRHGLYRELLDKTRAIIKEPKPWSLKIVSNELSSTI